MDLKSKYQLYGKYRTAPEGATLIERTFGKWIDLFWLDPARSNMKVYVCTRPAEPQ